MKKLLAVIIAASFAGASLASYAQAPATPSANFDTAKVNTKSGKKTRVHKTKHKAAAKTGANKKADEAKKS